jgi:hypothetical protein
VGVGELSGGGFVGVETESRVGAGVGPCGQSISKTRPSRFVILSEAKDDTREAASFDSQPVFFEMDWPLWPPAGCKGPRSTRSGGQPQGPQPHCTPPLPLRDALAMAKTYPCEHGRPLRLERGNYTIERNVLSRLCAGLGRSFW